MVYCTKCGAKNEEDEKVCVKCGASLYAIREGEHYRRIEGECFGIPHGGAVASVVLGLIIVLLGVSTLLSEVYKVNLPWWPFVAVLFGTLMIIGAVYGIRRRR
jgi:uncharacterized membrane protein YvbJ